LFEHRRGYVSADSEPIVEVPIESSAPSFEQVFQSHYSQIVRLISRVVRDPARAEDLAIEVFWRFWQKPPRKADPSGWLYRTAVRKALDDLRQQSRREKYERLFSFIRSRATPEQLYSEKETAQRVRKVLAALRPQHAEILILRSDGLSYQEIAEAIELSPTSIGTLLSRAKQAFQQEYCKRYGEQHSHAENA
jgi:RNA polymerase sigma factor (sigma-70 family)